MTWTGVIIYSSVTMGYKNVNWGGWLYGVAAFTSSCVYGYYGFLRKPKTN